MNSRRTFLGWFAALLVLPSVVASWASEPSAEQLEFFEAKIRPVLVKHCYDCHSSKVASPRGGLRLDDREAVMKGGDSGPAVVSNDPAKSPLIQALKYDGLEMPPKGKLPPAVIADFETWVKQGSPDPRVAALSTAAPTTNATSPKGADHWAFRKPAAQQPPKVRDEKWPVNDIDRFVLAKLEANQLQPAPAADRRTLIRRAYFDLIGLPPTPEQVAEFLTDSADDPTAFAKVVDELLKSPHYGERWARYWLDIARYAEDQAHTFKARRYPQGYLYRDWVVAALNNDMPYDQFLTWQIAGDLLETPAAPRHERVKALGLFALGPVYYQDNGEKDKAQADEWDDRVDTLIRGTQAITISCARCHDHKFDPVSMTDYYGLLGVFASTEYKEVAAAPDDVVQAKEKADAALKAGQAAIDRFLADSAPQVYPQLTPQIPDYVAATWQVLRQAKEKKTDKKQLGNLITAQTKGTKLNEELLKRWIALLDDGANDAKRADAEKSDAAKNNQKDSSKPEQLYLSGWRKLRETTDANVDLAKDKDLAAAVKAVGDELVALADPSASGDENQAWRKKLFADNGLLAVPAKDVGPLLVGDAAGELKKLNSERDRLKKEADAIVVVMAHSLVDGKAIDLPVYLAGDPKKKGAVAPRAFPAVFAGGERHLFQTNGSGRLELARAIASPDNPLTARVWANRIWAGHFGNGLVRTPSNFGTLGERPSHPELLDWLALKFVASGWSMKALHREIMLSATYRMSSSPAAEQLAAISQQDPDNRLLSHSPRRRLEVEPWRDALLAVSGNLDATLGGPSQNLNAGNRRRTLYGFVSRHQLDELLRLFDFPDPNITAGQRTVTTVPLQQLFVLNSEFMLSQAKSLAARLGKEASDDEARIRRAFQLLFGRDPTADELRLGLSFVTDTSEPAKLTNWEQYSLALMGGNEFLFVD